jgi:hypothetical protein
MFIELHLDTKLLFLDLFAYPKDKKNCPKSKILYPKSTKSP